MRTLIAIWFSCLSTIALAQGPAKPKPVVIPEAPPPSEPTVVKKPKAAPPAPAPAKAPAQPAADGGAEVSVSDKNKDAVKEAEKDKDKNWITVRGNFFDFDETLLQGKYKAPNGLMLQGRKSQEKKQMVNLRKDFRPNILNSRAAVRSISP